MQAHDNDEPEGEFNDDDDVSSLGSGNGQQLQDDNNTKPLELCVDLSQCLLKRLQQKKGKIVTYELKSLLGSLELLLYWEDQREGEDWFEALSGLVRDCFGEKTALTPISPLAAPPNQAENSPKQKRKKKSTTPSDSRKYVQ